MPKQRVIEQLQENIKLVYHKAVDADKAILALRENKHAKFTNIFNEDSIFKKHSDTFLPYVEELAADLQAVETDSEDHYQQLLPNIVLKIELLFKTLNAFKVAYSK
ncbi:MAG TPA: hypothetical protein EYH12_00400 [Psychromonas hadalis]|nr:hypothetical protein [Psychromonas hadalis]